jgi:hypothetical protein
MPNKPSAPSGLFLAHLPRLRVVGAAVLPWLCCLGLLCWGWRAYDLAHDIPAYWDVMEVLWATQWYGDAVRLHYGTSFYPLLFHPVGWQVATYAGGPAMFVALLPLYWLGGAALAYNVVTLATFLLAFGGSYTFARQFVGRLPSTVAAVLFAFWGFRWFRIEGHLNIEIASALLPWMLWCVERAINAPERSRWKWFLAAGLAWGLSVASSAYFAFIDGAALIVYLAPRCATRGIRWRDALSGMAVATTAAMLLSGPALYRLWQGISHVGVAFFSLDEVNALGASLNSLPIPSVWHPVLRSLARTIYSGPATEQGEANLGLFVSIMACVGLWQARRNKAALSLAALAGVGLVLALGPTLKWNDRSVSWGLLRPLDDLLWWISHLLKPHFFVPQLPAAPFDTAVPLPAWLMAAAVPFVERAREFARYALAASAGVFVLAALGLSRWRKIWIQAVLGALMVFEVLPPPTDVHPFPPETHPAFEWLARQSLSGEGIIDLYVPDRFVLSMPMRGETLYATLFHHQATAAGTSSLWPMATRTLLDWLNQHPHAFQNPDFIPLLRFYRVRYIALQIRGGYDQQVLDEEAVHHPELSLTACFPAPARPGPWDYPICILEILPERNPGFNLLPREGWSGEESWGRWIEGTEARAEWFATAQETQHLSIAAFPNCVPGIPQAITLSANGQTIATHEWNGCDPWSGEVEIPASLVQVGANELAIRAAFAAAPVSITRGANPDPRRLSVGVTRLRVGG